MVVHNASKTVTVILTNYTPFRRRKKKTCFTGEQIPKNGRSGIFFVKYFFFLHFLPKLPEKIAIFSCSLRSKFFIQIFVQKMADFTILGIKKN